MIGASASPMKWGFIILSNIVGGGYKGKVYPVNPTKEKILGLKVYPKIEDISDEMDLAVIATPGSTVPGLLEECSNAGVKSCIVISAGFSEVGEKGKKREEEIVKIARIGDIKLVGPNTMGVYSSSVSLVALMPPMRPGPGHVAFISQSGNLGTQMLAWGQSQGVGFSKFVSSGNEADVKCEDYLKYFGDDPETKIILIYMEGLDNGRRFMEVARDVTARKPVIVLKKNKSWCKSCSIPKWVQADI
jgi:acetyltransferase